LIGRVFDRMGAYRPVTIQLLALPALIPCLLMFALPRYQIQGARRQPMELLHEPQPAEIAR